MQNQARGTSPPLLYSISETFEASNFPSKDQESLTRYIKDSRCFTLAPIVPLSN